MKRWRRARRAGSPSRFIQIPYWVLETESARNLTGTATKVLVYLLKRFDGTNNGKICFGVRSGCFCRTSGSRYLTDFPIGLSKSRIAVALKELELSGFIRCTKPASFDQKRLVREWRLTWLPCNEQPATADFCAPTQPKRNSEASPAERTID
jgi:hypothetical protein